MCRVQVAVDYLENCVRGLGQHNANLVQQLQQSMAVAAGPGSMTAAGNVGGGAASDDSDPNAAASQAVGTASCNGPVPLHTLHNLIAAATKVNEKNKRLKQQLMALRGSAGGSQ